MVRCLICLIDYKLGYKMSKKDTKWMQKSVKKPGAFTAQAKKAGKGVQAYAKEVLAHKDEHSTTTVKRAALAKTFAKVAKKRKK
jgi:hypothetical protein